MTRPPSPSSPSPQMQKVNQEITPVSNADEPESPVVLKDANTNTDSSYTWTKTDDITCQTENTVDNTNGNTLESPEFVENNHILQENIDNEDTVDREYTATKDNVAGREVTITLKSQKEISTSLEKNLETENTLERNNSKSESKELRNSGKNLRNSRDEKRFHVGSVSTERQFPNSSRISLLKLFDSPVATTPKIEEPGSSPMSLPSARHNDHGKRLTFGSRREKEVLIGTPVKEGHANYVLMYDMLTGIRISVRL